MNPISKYWSVKLNEFRFKGHPEWIPYDYKWNFKDQDKWITIDSGLSYNLIPFIEMQDLQMYLEAATGMYFPKT